LAIAKRLKRGTSVLTAKGLYVALRPYAHRKREKNGAVLLWLRKRLLEYVRAQQIDQSFCVVGREDASRRRTR